MRNIATAAAVFLLTLPVGASTIAIALDQETYAVGDTITLTITGDAEGAQSWGIFGELTYSSVLTDTIGSSQTILTTDGQEWFYGPTFSEDGRAYVWNQVAGMEPLAPDGPAVSTVHLVANYGGTLQVNWTDELDFFGTTSSPGLLIPIVGDPPPLPPLPPPDPGPPPRFRVRRLRRIFRLRPTRRLRCRSRVAC